MTRTTRSPAPSGRELAADLSGLTLDQLADRYAADWGRPPRVRHRAWITRQIIRRAAERENGGLSRAAQARLGELMAAIVIPGEAAGTPESPPPARGGLAVGSVLTRQWKGQQIRVEVTADGFEWRGETYRSLTALAKAVTGSHMSGNRFFGIAPVRRQR